ncbi:MAG: DMT family transporter [Planctomycetaceae bacterium]|jgi:drug/metabolite transporter (DMT)-like permease|nr:DMT family transporter [Planctomycetaceae bacterium]
MSLVELSDVPSGRERWSGVVFAFFSTFFYGASNVSMRLLTEYEVDYDWILFYKELFGFVVLLPWLLLRFFQGRFDRISRRLILFMAFAAIICELIGSHLQVIGYAMIGLIITVPLVQSSTLIGVAILGRYVLGDLLSRRRKFAIVTLIVAVVLLSVGKEMTATEGDRQGGMTFIFVAIGAVVAGCAYSIYIVILRYSMRKYWNEESSVWQSFQFTRWAGFDIPPRNKTDNNPKDQNVGKQYAPFPVTLAMNIILGVGVVIFAIFIFVKHGVSGFYDVPVNVWYIIPVSGVCNMVGFFFQIQGLRMTSAVQASLIGVSQMIVLSVIGFMYFRESVNFAVTIGLFLVAYGVVISAKPENKKIRNTK